MQNALVSIQILPQTPNGESVIPYVDKAISLIEQAGVSYRVGPLETTMEGELHKLLQLVAKLHEEMVKEGCPQVLAQVKILYNPAGVSMGALTNKYE